VRATLCQYQSKEEFAMQRGTHSSYLGREEGMHIPINLHIHMPSALCPGDTIRLSVATGLNCKMVAQRWTKSSSNSKVRLRSLCLIYLSPFQHHIHTERSPQWTGANSNLIYDFISSQNTGLAVAGAMRTQWVNPTCNFVRALR
jgi:hypothetical protein